MFENAQLLPVLKIKQQLLLLTGRISCAKITTSQIIAQQKKLKKTQQIKQTHKIFCVELMRSEQKNYCWGCTHRERECRITVSGRLSRPRVAWVSAFVGAPYRGAFIVVAAPPPPPPPCPTTNACTRIDVCKYNGTVARNRQNVFGGSRKTLENDESKIPSRGIIEKCRKKFAWKIATYLNYCCLCTTVPKISFYQRHMLLYNF